VVAAPGGAVCFLGKSGRGKSTLAASLFLSHGFLLVSDDVAAIRKEGNDWVVQPGPPTVKLSPALLRRVGRRRLFHPSPRPLPLRALYLLERRSCDRVRIELVRGRESLMALTRNTLHLADRSPQTLRSNFRLTARVAAAKPVKRLIYPNGLDRLPEVCREIEDDLVS